ncbi:MAG: DUF1292 domain-containing protein [Clostridia bacterium]|nr:DUF1292 domain-containing protein [Clostridia bacterium]
MKNELEIVALIGNDGEEEEFVHELTFKYEGNLYAAVTPIAQMDDDEAEIIFLRIDRSSGGDVYSLVDNEVLLDELFDEFLNLLDEMDDDE